MRDIMFYVLSVACMFIGYFLIQEVAKKYRVAAREVGRLGWYMLTLAVVLVTTFSWSNVALTVWGAKLKMNRQASIIDDLQKTVGEQQTALASYKLQGEAIAGLKPYVNASDTAQTISFNNVLTSAKDRAGGSGTLDAAMLKKGADASGYRIVPAYSVEQIAKLNNVPAAPVETTINSSMAPAPKK